MDKKQTYQEFLEERHGKHQVSDSLLSMIVKKATGQIIKTKSRLIKGENSEVYDIETDKDTKIIVRIARNEWSGFDSEEWALNQCRSLDIPIPKTLFVGEISQEKESVRVSVQNKLPGIPLNEIEGKDENFKKKIIVQAGDILNKIHTIKVEKFGSLDDKGNGSFSIYREYMEDRAKNVPRLINLEVKTDISGKDISQALEIIKNNDSWFDDVTQSILLHNDFSPKHLLVDEDKITGLIDFETVQGGDPLQEFARWNYYYGEEFPLEWLVEGYGESDLLDNDFESKIHFLRLHFCLNVIDYYEMTENYPGLAHAKQELEKDLKYFTGR